MEAITLDPAPGGRLRRAWAPLATGGLLAASAIYVGVVTPGGGRTLPCPFHAATGLWCPGCGMTRGVHRLLRGDLLGALSYNLFVPLVVLGAAIGWWSWFAGRAWARPLRIPSRVGAPLGIACFGLFIVYGVLRNLAPFNGLAP